MQRNEKGQVVETFPPEDVLAALDEIGPAGTREVSDKLGSAYETAYKKLRSLEDDGRVTSRKVGNALLWVVDESENGNENESKSEASA